MRYPNSPVWDIWQSGDYTGDNAVVGAVTVEPDFWLNRSYEANAEPPGTEGNYIFRHPLRWWRKADNDQIERIVPNVRLLEGTQSLDQDAATVRITIANSRVLGNDEPHPAGRNVLGEPGYYSPQRGGIRTRLEGRDRAVEDYPSGAAEAHGRWGHEFNEWWGMLDVNALIRTYVGHWGAELATEEVLEEAKLADRVHESGVWLVDRVFEDDKGNLVLDCRDMAKLVLDQNVMPPIVPDHLFPLRYQRWREEKVPPKPAVPLPPLRVGYLDSSGDRWYPGSIVAGRGAQMHGHYPSDAIDRRRDTYWLSVGNSHGSKPFAYDWIELNTYNQQFDHIWIEPLYANLQIFVSVMEDGVWQGSNVIPYDHTPLIGGQPHVVDTGADIPYVVVGGAAPSGSAIKLPRRYRAQRIRITMHNHSKSQWGPWFYRAGIKEVYPSTGPGKPAQQGYTRKVDGNYRDYSDIVKQLLMWSGFYLLPPVDTETGRYSIWQYDPIYGQPKCYGNIESTGAYAEEPLPADMFHRLPVIEPITKLKEIIGYIFFVDEEGAPHFECVDDRTEALTRRGWVSGAEVDTEDEVLSLNPDTGLTEWVRVDEVVRYDLEEEPVVRMTGRAHNSVTTTNHRWWVTPAHADRGGGRWVTSSELTTESRIPIAAPRGDAPTTPRHLDEFVELVAWWYTEGTICAGGKRGVISQSARVNPELVDRIRACFEKLGGPQGFLRDGFVWAEYETAEDMVGWRFKGEVFDDLTAVAPDRVPTPEFLTSLTAEQAALFVDVSVAADGHTWGGKYSEFVQKDPRRVAAFEMACVLAGRAFRTRKANPKHRDVYRTKVLHSTGVKPVGAARNKGAAGSVTTTPYTGSVWCPKLARNHIWLARREGTVYFTGNSPNWWQSGNMDQLGNRIAEVPQIDEKTILVSWKVARDGTDLRSSITVATEQPSLGLKDTVSTVYYPPTRDMLRGISRPAEWINGHFLKKSEQQIMAELIGIHIWFSVRTGELETTGCALIGVNDQVRIFEEKTGEAFIHYIRAKRWTHNFETGEYRMSLTTN